MQIISYNINGIRAAIRKGFIDWLSEKSVDIICLQEIKADTTQFETKLFEELGYNCFWHPAKKKGYSGVAILSKKTPKKISYGCNNAKIDQEGRIIKAEFNDIIVYSCYFPSGSSGEIRQEYKMYFLDFFYSYIKKELTKKPIVISGDFNICHTEIDIHNPISNKKTSGFLPEERNWLSAFLELGFIDSFRAKNNQPDHYSWWSYRANARLRNKGWRIDYHIMSDSLKDELQDASIMSNVHHSDHCPVYIKLK